MGLGNPLMGDDGVGLAALARLEDGPPFDDVEFVEGATWGLSLLPMIERADRLILVDAITAGARPGEIVELARDRLPVYLSRKLSPHQVDIRDALAVAELRGRMPGEVVAIGVEPESIDMRTSLSDPVERALDALVGRVVAQLERWGHTYSVAGGPADA